MLALGLDGGGTQTRVALAGPDGMLCGMGTGGACNIAAVQVDVALASAFNAAQDALAQAGASAQNVGAVCAGVAGASVTVRRDAFAAGLQARFPNARVDVVPDYAIALAGATNGQPGLIVIAGTGSVAYGEAASGLAHKAGGYGYVLDDAGSGYGVGRAALAAVLRAADGTGAPTTLTERILTAGSLTSVGQIVPGVYGGPVDRVTIASLSRVVAEAARFDEDQVARAILMRAGGALALLAQAVTSALFDADSLPFPIVRIGGLWNAGPDLTDVFARSCARFAPQAVLTDPQNTPVQGAVLRALSLLA